MRPLIWFLIALVILVIAFLPWLLFWCIEVLFNYNIDVTLRTWTAALILIAIANTGNSSKK